MLQITQELLQKIEAKIDSISQRFQRVQGLILTEDDLKCLLYAELSTIPELSGYDDTRESHIKANKIHSELSWFNEQEALRFFPDITILDTQNLSILRGIDREMLPSKQSRFVGDAVIFELKFVRKETGIDDIYFRTEIEKDWKKIQRLFEHNRQAQPNSKLYCFFVIFSKVDKIDSVGFEELMEFHPESNNHKIIYRSAQVVF